MGASAQRPTSSTPGAGGSSFYRNALNQQKQAVANMGPGGSAAAGKPTSAPGEDSRYLDAYNRYMQGRSGGSQYPPTQGSPFGQSQPPAPNQQPAAGLPPGQNKPPMRRPMDQEQSPTSPKGITMGGGYANRPFG